MKSSPWEIYIKRENEEEITLIKLDIGNDCGTSELHKDKVGVGGWGCSKNQYAT